MREEGEAQALRGLRDKYVEKSEASERGLWVEHVGWAREPRM